MASDMRHEMERLALKFADELLGLFGSAVMVTLSAGTQAPAAPKAPPRKVGRPRKAPVTEPVAKHGRLGPKSTPAEVEALGRAILDVLRKASSPMSAADLQAALKAPAGSFHYALGKLKSSKAVTQHGERRSARYAVAGEKGAPTRTKAPAKKAATKRAPAKATKATPKPRAKKAAAAPAETAPAES